MGAFSVITNLRMSDGPLFQALVGLLLCSILGSLGICIIPVPRMHLIIHQTILKHYLQEETWQFCSYLHQTEYEASLPGPGPDM